jgi:hypothetical protein
MMTATQARTATNDALTAQAEAIAVSKAREQAEIDVRRNARTSALDRRIDALVDRFLADTVLPAISEATSNGGDFVRFNTRKHYGWRGSSDTSLDTLIENSVFGGVSRVEDRWGRKVNVRGLSRGQTATLFGQSHLHSHKVVGWGGVRISADCTLEFHILHRVAARVEQAGFDVSLPEVQLSYNCKVQEQLTDLVVSW